VRTVFRITHPFHPLREQEFERLSEYVRWGRIYFHYRDAEGQERTIEAAWTSLFAPDPFFVMSKGEALFRPDDLFDLARLLDALKT